MHFNWISRLVAAAWILWLLVPVPVGAQQASGIAGAARDSSGAVLPGVTVEVAGRAFYAGEARFWREADDPLGGGFLLRR